MIMRCNWNNTLVLKISLCILSIIKISSDTFPWLHRERILILSIKTRQFFYFPKLSISSSTSHISLSSSLYQVLTINKIIQTRAYLSALITKKTNIICHNKCPAIIISLSVLILSFKKTHFNFLIIPYQH